ncbi:transmembrane protein, putative [Medicago truncatula]|uniref:Transmembrane protein, putative n=1 Tax=Medicago truncatula TaxID=3880 RepID=G7JB57_MEDTR|nr:transmembrane protein, putative [Medicago truncatula]
MKAPPLNVHIVLAKMEANGVEPLIMVQECMSCLCSALLADNLRVTFLRDFFFFLLSFYCVAKKFIDINKNRM